MFKNDIAKLKECEHVLRELSAKYPDVSIFTDLKNQLDEIQRAYGMMRSCLIYGDDFEHKYSHNYCQYIPENKLEEMYEAYIDYFNEHGEVVKNVGIDSDGVTYNSFIEI